MTQPEFTIRQAEPGDDAAIAALAARAFGPGRFTRTAYRVREGVTPLAPLSLTGWLDGRLVGAVRFTALEIGDRGGALLLGPLTVHPDVAGKGCGRALIREGLAAARRAGYRLVILVGDLPYYEKAGFARVPAGQIRFPGPVDPARILAAELDGGALDEFTGLVRGVAPKD